MRRNQNHDKEIEKVRESVRKEVAPIIDRVDRVREENRRINAQMAREWQLIRGEPV